MRRPHQWVWTALFVCILAFKIIVKVFPLLVNAHTCEECEEKLKMLIVEMKAEIAEARRLMDLGEGNGQPPEGKEGKRGKKKNLIIFCGSDWFLHINFVEEPKYKMI